MSIERLLCEAVHVNYPKYFANFPPNNPVKIGDFGYLKNDSFDYEGNVEAVFNIKIGEIRPGNHADVEFKSKAGVSVRASAKGDINASGIADANAEAIVEFKKANSVFFKATGCQIKLIEDKTSFGNQILNLFEENRWKKKFVVVTSIIEARTLNLFISHSENALIKLKANSNLPDVNVFDAGVDCSVVQENGIANKWVAEENTIPLIGLSKISFWGEFRTKYLVGDEEEEGDLEELQNQIKNSGLSIREAFQLSPIDES